MGWRRYPFLHIAVDSLLGQLLTHLSYITTVGRTRSLRFSACDRYRREDMPVLAHNGPHGQDTPTCRAVAHHVPNNPEGSQGSLIA